MSASKLLENFLAYSKALADSLEPRDDVTGLLFLGSAADHSRVDEWSDHDFFVVTKDGKAEDYRQDLSWLPKASEIAISPRETAHGLKVVYEDGQVLEFAIFDESEFDAIGGVNDHLIAIDKTDIAARLQPIIERSIPKPANLPTTFELFLSQLLIGVGRARRGEVLIASQHVRSWAMSNVVTLLRAWAEIDPASTAKHDTLNGFRRFEQQYPQLGGRLEELAQMPVEACAKELLHLIQPYVVKNLDEKHQHQIYVVRHRLGWV